MSQLKMITKSKNLGKKTNKIKVKDGNRSKRFKRTKKRRKRKLVGKDRKKEKDVLKQKGAFC